MLSFINKMLIECITNNRSILIIINFIQTKSSKMNIFKKKLLRKNGN